MLQSALLKQILCLYLKAISFLIPPPAVSLYFTPRSPDSSSQDILISVPLTYTFGISMKHEKSICKRQGRQVEVEDGVGIILGVKWSCRCNATKKKTTDRKQRDSDRWMSPEVQWTQSLCLDNDFSSSVMSSLVNEVIKGCHCDRSITLYLGKINRHLTLNDLWHGIGTAASPLVTRTSIICR